MADLQTKDFQTIVREQVAAIQGGTSRTLVDLTVGSVLRAIVEAYAAIALWLQGLILKVLAITRAATSAGADLDSWVFDYGLVRLGATTATGQATFARFTPTLQAVVPIGASIQSADGTQQYVVTLDVENAAYNAGFGGYVIGAGITSVAVPISAVTAGSLGNAAIGGINTLGQAIPGVDTVSNAAALDNGSDAETDNALRARFVRFIASLSKATKAASEYAATSVESGIVCELVENENYDGTAHLGYYYLVIDDGSGEPASDLLSTVYNAVDAVRPVTVTFGVFGPIIVTANVTLTITVGAGYVAGTVRSLVDAAITSHVNALPLGTSLIWASLIRVAFDASDGVVNVTALLVNGGTSDIAATPKQRIRAGSVVAS